MGIEIAGMIGTGNYECVGFTIDAGTNKAMTCYFKDDGTSTGTARYFNLSELAYRVAILSTQDCSLTHINGRELNTPIPISNTGWNQFTVGIQWNNITIRADVDATAVIVLAY